jgi:hypothetical protein
MLALTRGQVEHVLPVRRRHGLVTSDMPFDDLGEAFCSITCVATYVRFVLRDGNTNDEYRAFVTRTPRERSSLPDTPDRGCGYLARKDARSSSMTARIAKHERADRCG